MSKIAIVLLLALLHYTIAGKTVDRHLSTSDLQRLQKVFHEGIKSNDLQAIFFSSINVENLSQDEKITSCQRLIDVHKESKLNDFEKNYYLSNAHKKLACTTPLHPDIISTIKASLTKEISTTQEIYYNIMSTKSLNIVLDDATKTRLSKNLQNILKKDDSLNSLGHAFYVAVELGKDGIEVYERVEDAIVQADEIDNKMLQFEGGLSITSLVINGALKLCSSLNKPMPINADQTMKFTYYFLSRKSVQTAKGASILLESLNAISKLKDISPISIELVGNGQILPENQRLSIKICDILGNPLVPHIAIVQATITAKQGSVELASKINLAPSANDKTIYSIDLKQYKPSRGIYNVDIVAGNAIQKLSIKVLGKVKVRSLEIGVGDSDSSSQFKKQTITFPNKLTTDLNADSQQKVVIKASLVDEENDKPVTVHQCFVRLNHKESGEEIIFVAEQDTTKSYKFDMDVGARASDFGHKSGVYTVELIVGDSSISNSFKWHLSDIQLKFVTQENVQKSESLAMATARTARPEIEHKFREPESRPPKFFSDLFSLLCIAPLILLLILWAKLRVNISHFPFSLSAIGFHLGFGAILALFVVFWLKLNMFETIRYLLPLVLFTFLCGNRLLRSIAAKKLEK